MSRQSLKPVLGMDEELRKRGQERDKAGPVRGQELAVYKSQVCVNQPIENLLAALPPTSPSCFPSENRIFKKWFLKFDRTESSGH